MIRVQNKTLINKLNKQPDLLFIISNSLLISTKNETAKTFQHQKIINLILIIYFLYHFDIKHLISNVLLSSFY